MEKILAYMGIILFAIGMVTLNSQITIIPIAIAAAGMLLCRKSGFFKKGEDNGEDM